MPDEPRHGDDSPPEQHPLTPPHDDVRYEGAEASFRGVLIVLVAIACIFALVGYISREFIKVYSHKETLPRTPDSYVESEEALPREPRLEPLEVRADTPPPHPLAQQFLMQQIRDSYGPGQDEQHVRVPIDVAIQVMSKQAATRGGELETLSKSFGLVGSGEPNSGRNYQEAPSWLQTRE